MENPINRSYLAKLKAHSPDVADAIEFLDGLSRLLLDEDLKKNIELRSVVLGGMLASHQSSVFIPRKLSLLGITCSYTQGQPRRYVAEIPHLKSNNAMLRLSKLIDELLQNISKLLLTFVKYNDMSSKLQQFRNMLTCLKPLARYVEEYPEAFTGDDLIGVMAPLFDVLEAATRVIYLAIIFRTHDPMAAFLGICELLEVTNIEKMYLTTLRIPTSDLPESLYPATVPSKLYLLNNLLLISYLVFCNDEDCNKLHGDLFWLENSIINLNDSIRLTKLHYLEETVEDIFRKAIPIIYSCYVEGITEDMLKELNEAVTDALNQIELFNTEFSNTKLHNHPKTDDVGFMELFLDHLEELLEDQHIPILEKDIHTLHCEVYSLMCFPKVTQEKLDEDLWAHIMQLVYEAEYVIDLYLVRPNDANLISSLSHIIDRVKYAREKLVMEYLIEGDKDTDVVLVVEFPSTLPMSLTNGSANVHHFDIRARCSVSSSYQKREALLQILGDVIGDQDDISLLTTEGLIEKLYISLEKRRFLIILEDLWDIRAWNDLKQHFPENRNYSRILITTRLLEDVALQIIRVGCKLHDCSGEIPLSQDIATSSSNALSMATQENDVLVGFEKETASIMDFLVGGEKALDVISIVGMAGIGKTTLAMSLFKASATHHFDIQAWCVISQSYQRRELFRKILDQVNPLDSNITDLDEQELADRLCRSLKKRKYLIVIDDIWDVVVWNDLKRYLPDDRQGSRILMTTRSEIVSIEAKSKVHALHGLTKEQSCELLLKKLPQMQSSSLELLHIANRIAESCRGLPLSIVIAAGLLSDLGKSEKKWNEIAQNVNSHILADPEGKCKTMLELSYNHLPHHLQSCFLHVGTFPEDREIPISHLKNLWIAEGFVRDTDLKISDDVADEYLGDLIVRNLVIPAKERSQGGIKAVYLHDLLRDFCLEKAKEENFMAVIDEINYSDPPLDPRRLSINSYMDQHIKFSLHSIRSLIFFSQVDGTEIDWRIESYDMLLLRVLDICELQLPPFCIPRLIHLRYLAIWKMYENYSILLPLITKLRNLHVLIFEDSEIEFYTNAVVEVPDSIWDMMKLRYVRIGPRASFLINRERLENSSSLLKNLRSLSKPRVSYGDFCWLRKLPNLRRLSCIFLDTSDDVSPECNRFRALHTDCQLTSLTVEYQNDFQMQRLSSENLLSSSLLLPTSLKKLTLSSFKLFPEDMSRIGSALPNLEVLKLYNCAGINDATWSVNGEDIYATWNVNDEDFPRLKTLKLWYLGFEKWTATEDSFPCIEQLILDCCFRLDEIPIHFGDIPALRYILVRNCKPSVVSLVRDIEYMQKFETLNSELKVDIFIPNS